MARVLAVLLLSWALSAPSAALAQNDPFSPLPPPRPAPTVEPTDPANDLADQEPVSRATLLGIAGGVLVVFIVIGAYITRDARRNLTDEDRRALERAERRGDPDPAREGERRPKPDDAKRKARAKAKAQRQARKAQRRR